ncbi:HK97 gp10 family phage protein [Novosphingobium kunmingense]|uniref:HK97 gp10 family phage protein n=1 Tax=Novosphingobium kunmingense TaxID=1211806 RepID=A0A2N0HLA4_9SPHN|nr:HK97-gp10 family putative phage morphogenesis protein [Novosphingobium kunmingense]PKB19655.1 HK97 gp10 family phage protein [Novosphingobium kunmingense]
MSGLVKVEGLADLEKLLFELGSPSTARRVGQRALLTAAEPMVEAIKGLAPKDEMNLAASVKAQASNRNRRNDVAEVVIGIDGSVKPTTTVPRQRAGGKRKDAVKDLGVSGYGPMQEFGTEKMAANPFFRPGFDATAETVIRRTGTTIGPEYEKAAARLAKRRARAG